MNFRMVFGKLGLKLLRLITNDMLCTEQEYHQDCYGEFSYVILTDPGYYKKYMERHKE